MIKAAIIILVTLMARADVNEKWWLAERKNLKQEILDDNTYTYKKTKTSGEIEALSEDQVKFIFSVLKNPAFENLTFMKVLGKGSYGTVFEATRKDNGQSVSVKFMFQTNDKYAECVETYETYQKLASVEGVKYLIQIDPPKFFNTGSSYACTMTMEKGTATDKPFFTTQDADKRKNTAEFVQYMVRLLESFYTINFKARFYHGDVKPGNILFMRTDKGLEPRIIDFDLIFKKKSDHYNPSNIIYTLDYRPPELRRIVKATNPTAEERRELRKYNYDADFREESWAVGKTILDIIASNERKGTILSSDSALNQIRAIAGKMTTTGIGERICTEIAYQEALKVVEGRRRII